MPDKPVEVSQIIVDYIIQAEHEKWINEPEQADIRDEYPHWTDLLPDAENQQTIRDSARFIIETYKEITGR
jgi:hypothetical protein